MIYCVIAYFIINLLVFIYTKNKIELIYNYSNDIPLGDLSYFEFKKPSMSIIERIIFFPVYLCLLKKG